MTDKPLYRVAQNETVRGWPILDRDDNVVAHYATRSEAREQCRQLIFGNEHDPDEQQRIRLRQA